MNRCAALAFSVSMVVALSPAAAPANSPSPIAAPVLAASGSFFAGSVAGNLIQFFGRSQSTRSAVRPFR